MESGSADYGASQVLLALRVGSFRVASDLQFSEPQGAGRVRMQAALRHLEDALVGDAGEFYVRGQIPDLTAMLDGSHSDDRRAFLLEVLAADPFAPYWFEWTKARRTEHAEAVNRLAVQSLDLTIEDSEAIQACWQRVTKAEAKATKRPWSLGDYLRVGLGAAAVAGAAVLAGPLIAAAMPAAAGLSGAAAVSAGMAQLGFGSIAAGGLGMTGGMWMLGLAGGAVGATGGTVSTALQGAIERAGSGDLLRKELMKLLVCATLAAERGWFEGDLSQFGKSVDEIVDEVATTLDAEGTCNDPDAPRLAELQKLLASATFVGEELSDLISERSRPMYDED